MATAKLRYQIHKENEVKDIDETEVEGQNMEKNNRRKLLTEHEIIELEKMEILSAEGRRVYDPIGKSFDHGNKRCTDLSENTKVHLPNPCDNFTESSIELIKKNVMKTFTEYKNKMCNEKG